MKHRGLPILLLAMVVLAWPGLAAARETTARGKVGNDTCLGCHEDAGKTFEMASHGRAKAACESCHGPGDAHANNPAATNIVNPRKAAAADANDSCLSCHAANAGQHWAASRHAGADVKCADCHTVHQPWTKDRALSAKSINEGCVTCHRSAKREMLQRSAHPLRTGAMTCTSCHNAHGSAGEASLKKVTVNETCNTCHADKRGPYLFEHAPVRENCMQCHAPHGSSNVQLLKMPTIRLCQSCHLLGHHQTVASQPGQVWAQNRSCVNCHQAIHGSNHPSGAILQR